MSTTEESPKIARRNFWLGVLNGTFYITGETIMDPTLVLATFVSRLTDSPLWIGLIVPLRDGSWFLPQLWVSSFSQSYDHKLPFYRKMALMRALPWLVFTITTLTVRDSTWMLIFFLLASASLQWALALAGCHSLRSSAKQSHHNAAQNFLHCA